MSENGPLTVLVYASDAGTRAGLVAALGTRIAADLPPITASEVATGPEVVARLDAGGVDLAILDGEAAPFGGMGLAKQIRDEVADPPPLLVVTARKADAWLAEWSRADAVVAQPLDPFELARTAARLLRTHPERRNEERYRLLLDRTAADLKRARQFRG